MAWQPIPITGGVVNSRGDQALQPGELVSSTGLRFKVGDEIQLHRDRGRADFGSTPNSVLGLFYAAFENITDKLIAVDANSSIYEAAAGDAGTFVDTGGVVGASPTAMDMVHRKNEYFLGTNGALPSIGQPNDNNVINEDGVRHMGMYDPVRNYVTIAGVPSAQFLTGTSGTQWPDAAVVVYWWTEYDSELDLESGPMYFYVAHGGSGASSTEGEYIQLKLPWDIGATKVNSNTDQIRLYRHFHDVIPDFIISTAADIIGQRYADGEEALTGGLIDTLDWGVGTTYNDGDGVTGSLVTADPSIAFPLIYENVNGVVSIVDRNKHPRPFDIGALFNDSLVVNSPGTSKNVLRYSPPGQPEYQPDAYFMYFATDSSDEILALHNVGNNMLVVMKGSIWVVTALPYDFNIQSAVGKLQEKVTDTEGCVGRKASTVMETDRGEWLVWLSRTGLRGTIGRGKTDMCPDFSVEGLGITATDLDDSVLINDAQNYRLQLWVNGGTDSKRYDFYYHPSLLKNGKFRMMGPFEAADGVTITATRGELDGEDRVWSATSGTVVSEGIGLTTGALTVKTGQLFPGGSPFRTVRVARGVGITHSSAPNTTWATVMEGALEGAGPTTGNASAPDLTYKETGRLQIGGRGNWLQVTHTLTGTEDISVGPVWLDEELQEDSNG